ncbi:MAG TPA: transcription antitermination factor NusB [Dysgonamonadaceae bacterium]|jgi:N utilization substance protein B|nr:transcription antitermination factor NusB [Dysgonamonadaceae bacterium]
MINRILIRIRVIQIVYAWYQNRNKDLRQVEKELLLGLQKSYDLYFYILLLMIEITDLYEKRVETKKNKFLPTHEDLNPKMHLINNQFINQLRNNRTLIKNLNERPMSWENNDSFVRGVLDSIIESDIYKEYTQIEMPTYNDDKDFWRKSFKAFIYRNVELDDILEDESIFWNDDIDIVQSFVHKTIRQFNKSEGEEQKLLPMFNDDEDKEYAVKLIRETIFNELKYREQITSHAKNWDFERIAFMDVIIMQVAMAELYGFPSIPISVTLNEYIDIAKSYSTPKSSTFINGILDAVVTDLKNDKTILKK